MRPPASATQAAGGVRPYRGRFAPSPTGWLHLGNARTALLAWLRARSHQGLFVLRVEDIDAPRTRPEAVTGNLAELRWLGLDWDEGPDVGGPYAPYLQSERQDRYRAALARLVAADLTFPCYLSRKELAQVASAPHWHPADPGAQPEEAAYGEAERALNARLAPAKRAAGVAPSIRFSDVMHDVRFVDVLAGPQHFNVGRTSGPFVLRRADGLWAYQLAVVVDDAAMGITEVVRGSDLLPSTAAQLLLYRALELKPPAFAHVAPLGDGAGERLAKRRGSLTLSQLQQAGVRPERVVGLLAHGLGLRTPRAEVSAAELLAGFDKAQTYFPTGRFTPADQQWLLAGARRSG